MVGRWIALVLFLTLLLAVGCTPAGTATPISAPSPTAEPVSAWGQVITAGQTEQAAGPALAMAHHQTAILWTGIDETGLGHWLARWDDGVLIDPVKLPAPARRVIAPSIFPALDQRWHMLWLDRHDSGEMRLFSVLLDSGLRVELGAVMLSETRTDQYTAALTGDQGLRVVWSGGHIVEPSLMTREIDPLGRPRPITTLVSGGSWPAITPAEGDTVWLFWLGAVDGLVYRGLLDGDSLVDARSITRAVDLSPGDRLTGFTAGRDRTHGYLFWNVARVNGTQETWFTTGEIDSSEWPDPTRPGITVTGDTATVETGYQSGAALPAESGDSWGHWAVPLDGAYGSLPVALNIEDDLGIVYFREGAITGYQPIIETGPLLGPPALAVGPFGALTLSWSQPTGSSFADMQFTTTGAP